MTAENLYEITSPLSIACILYPRCLTPLPRPVSDLCIKSLKVLHYSLGHSFYLIFNILQRNVSKAISRFFPPTLGYLLKICAIGILLRIVF